jgi:hypothetical protein
MGDPLSIYLNDHLAGATLGTELARRARDANRGSSYEEFFARLSDEIEEDRSELKAIMSSLGVGSDRLKVSAAWAAEKAGRLKLNGQLKGYAPLSRVTEIEALVVGVEGKMALWRGLKEIAATDARLDADSLTELADRAQRQLRTLRTQHKRAVRDALSTPG